MTRRISLACSAAACGRVRTNFDALAKATGRFARRSGMSAAALIQRLPAPRTPRQWAAGRPLENSKTSACAEPSPPARATPLRRELKFALAAYGQGRSQGQRKIRLPTKLRSRKSGPARHRIGHAQSLDDLLKSLRWRR